MMDATTGNISMRRNLLSPDDQQQQPPFRRRSLNESPTTTSPNNNFGLGRQASIRQGVLEGVLGKKQNNNNNHGPASPKVATIDEGVPGRKPKSFVYTMLNPRSTAPQAVAFKWFITFVICADLVSFVISTEPDLTEDQTKIFEVWEGVTSTIFLTEYVTRLVVVTEAQKYYLLGPVKGRIQYALTLAALVDLCCTIPFFLGVATGWHVPTLTFLRTFRLLRILKTSGFVEATNAVYRVIYYNRQIMYVACLICSGMVLFTSVLMYYLRPRNQEETKAFKSLGTTMYYCALMLTGQGSPDEEIPWYTKGVVLLTGVFSIGMIAIPASMLTWGFEAEAERCARLAYKRANKPPSEDDKDDNWSYSTCETTDEEYKKIIAGDDDAEIDQEAIKHFRLGELDTGSVSLSEYLAYTSKEGTTTTTTTKITTSGFEELNARFTTLETAVRANTETLHRVLQLLEESQPKTQIS